MFEESSDCYRLNIWRNACGRVERLEVVREDTSGTWACVDTGDEDEIDEVERAARDMGRYAPDEWPHPHHLLAALLMRS